MPIHHIRVRNKETGAIAWLNPRALAHFPDFEPADPVAPSAVFVEPPAADQQPAPVEPATTKKSRDAAKTDKE